MMRINLIKWVLGTAFGILLCAFGVSNLLATVKSDDDNVIYIDEAITTQIIRYELQKADKVILVWGVNDWDVVPEALQPPGTLIINQLMYTPMRQQDGVHEIQLNLPVGTAVNYLFQITKAGQGQTINVWDMSGLDGKHQTVVIENGLVLVTAPAVTIAAVNNQLFEQNWRTGSKVTSSILLLFGMLGVAYQVRHRLKPRWLLTLNPIGWLRNRIISIPIIFIILGNLVFLTGTAVFARFDRSFNEDWGAEPIIKFLLVQFNLGRENVAASWYASMIILAVGLLAFLCFWLDFQRFEGRPKQLSFGWLIVGFLFTGLSLDEIGSLHERVGMITSLNPFGDVPLGWVTLLAIPIGTVALFMLIFGWVHIRKNPWSFVLFGLGVLLFISVPFQEKFEIDQWHSAAVRDAWQRPIWQILLEEGTELFASLSFFGATAVYAHTAYQGIQSETRRSPFTSLKVKLPQLLTALLVLIGLFGIGLTIANWVLYNLDSREGLNGITINWFPSTIAFLTAVVCIAISFIFPNISKWEKWVYRSAGIIFLMLSLFYGSAIAFWLEDVAESGLYLQGETTGGFTLFLLGIGLFWLWHIRVWWIAIPTVLALLLSIWAFQIPNPILVEPAFWALSSWFTAVIFHLYYWLEQNEPIQEPLLT